MEEKMQELSIKEIQEIELRLLIQFHQICQEQRFRYSLCGGSLIGAVRHKGFIPWDDDIDVIMPRPDYDQFLLYCKNNDTPFGIINNQSISNYYGLYSKLWDRRTVIQDDSVKMNYDIGVNIDVFPVDGLGNSLKEAYKQYKKTSIQRELLNAATWKKFSRSRTHNIVIEPIRLLFFIVSRFINFPKLLNNIERINHSRLFDECKYVGDIAGSYRKKEIMERRIFEGIIEVTFEGFRMSALKNYDEYLTHIYGDYLSLPPIEKRKSHHTYKAFKK